MADGLGDAPSGFYAALGVKFGAEAEEMKKAYRRQSLKYHPDRNPSEEAKSSFQLVNNAWSCLSEPARRLEYDGVFRMRCVLEQGQLSAAARERSPPRVVGAPLPTTGSEFSLLDSRCASAGGAKPALSLIHI